MGPEKIIIPDRFFKASLIESLDSLVNPNKFAFDLNSPKDKILITNFSPFMVPITDTRKSILG